ncbi:hypothetical protein RUND412_003639 [Rhizina undulata]
MATKPHCLYCFEVLSAHLDRRRPHSLEKINQLYVYRLAQKPANESAPNGIPNGTSTNGTPTPESAPLFVTWNKVHNGEKHLRGCIGTFEAQPLEAGLKSYAITSAMFDTRFNPISRKELPSLECAVTLLMDFEPAADAMDWEVGVHGIRISFVYHGKRMGATYLPDVAAEQGWDKEETLINLMRKAGWGGRRDEWRKVELTVIRYKGSKACASYSEYVELMEVEEEMEEEMEEDEDDEEVEDY